MKCTRAHLILMAVAALFALAGCASALKDVAVRSTTSILEDSVAALSAETDTIHAQEASASLLVMLEGLILSDKGNRTLLQLSTQAYGSYAFGFLEETAPARARRFYLRGRNHGLNSLLQRSRLAAAMKSGIPELKKALSNLDKSDLPLLFWTAYCWSGWINLSRDNPDALADLPRVEAMMARALEIDPGYYFGGPDLFFGVYYGGRSKLLGGDPGKAKLHFERSIAQSGGRFLMAKVLYARYYAVQTQNRDLFIRLLKETIAAPRRTLPEQALANALAKERAKALLKDADNYF
ncbi:MAG: TRAP transporter TatT component family protein [bacterium]|nr:TRAP transporter TatT component family protein [bacterium]